MGRIVTPTYRVEYQDNDQPREIVFVDGARTIATLPGSLHWKSMCWNGKRDGRPTAASLERWRQGYNRSFQPGGTNWRVSQAIGHVIHIQRARIVHQKSGEIIATVAMPMFEVA